MAKLAKGATVTQRANGSWRVQIRKVGFPYESRDFLTHDEADDWAMRRIGEIRTTGKLVIRREAERVTFAQAIERYIKDVTSKRPGEASRAAEEARLGRFVREETKLVSYALAHLTPALFEDWRDRRLAQLPSRGQIGGRGQYKREVVPPGRLRADGQPRKNAAAPKPEPKPLKPIAPGTVKREMTLLKRVLDFSMKTYHLASNPLDIREVERPSVQDQRDVRLNEADWEKLLAECRASGNPWLAPIVEVAVEVGPRRGSVLKMRWEDVDLAKAKAILRRVKNSRKPSEVRDVEIGLTPRAVAILCELPRSIDGKVFPVTTDAIASAFKRARTRAGLGHFRFHDSRHEMASTLVEAGWGMLEVMAQGDWRDPKSVWRYFTADGQKLGAKLALLPARGGKQPRSGATPSDA